MNLLNYHLFAIIGYIFLCIVSGSELITNYNNDDGSFIPIIGSIIVICGFIIGIVEKIYNNRESNLLNSDSINNLSGMPVNKIGIRYIILFIFYFLNCYFPMTENKLKIEMAALKGYYLVMFNVENKAGNIILLIFYILATLNNFINFDNSTSNCNSNSNSNSDSDNSNFNIFKIISTSGNMLMILYFLFEVIRLFKN